MRLTLLFVLLSLSAFGSNPSVSPEKLDKAIRETITKERYQWRMPREKFQEKERGIVLEFFDGVYRTVQRWLSPIKRWISEFLKWLRKRMPVDQSESAKDVSAKDKQTLLILLIAVASVLLLVFLWRLRRRRRMEQQMEAVAIVPLPDLAQDDIVADQLPEDGWQQMAQDLLSRGELRLALRAMFMASLVLLARTEMITVAKFKSNRDYRNELKRRGHTSMVLLDAFSENIVVLEKVWYGRYEVTKDMLTQFIQNQESMKRSAA